MIIDIVSHIVISTVCFLPECYFFKKMTTKNQIDIYPLYYVFILIVAFIPVVNVATFIVVFGVYVILSLLRLWKALCFTIDEDMGVTDIFKTIIKRYKLY